MNNNDDSSAWASGFRPIERYWHIYTVGSIDWFWGCMRTVEDTVKEMHMEFVEMDVRDDSLEILRMHKHVKSLASQVGFDGKLRSEYQDRVFWLPPECGESTFLDDSCFVYGFVWKQDNNGTCFIASPYEMVWLHGDFNYLDYVVFRMDNVSTESESVTNAVQTYVYAIEALGVGKIKIGVSINPEKRLKQLETGCPNELRLLASIRGSITLEREIHRQFNHLRDKGEWFFAANELREWIESHGENKEGQLHE